MSSRWLFSTTGRRGYAVRYFREADPSVFILGTGNSPDAPAFRDCDDARILPAIADPSYHDAVLELVQRERIENILTFSDLDVASLAKIRPELSALGINCFFPGEQLTQLALSKLATSEWANSNGFLAPRSSRNIADFDSSIPLIVKPECGSSSIGLSFPNDHEAAAQAASELAEPLFQQRILGVEYNLEICGDLDGRPVRCSAWRKHHSRGGETSLSRSVRRDDLIDLSWRLGDALGLIGPNDVDLIIADGAIYIIEVNTRFGGGYPVSHLAGAGFPDALLRMAAGERLEREATFRDGIWMLKALDPFGGTDDEMNELLGVRLSDRFT
ncbi:MAG: ATP-grasp domain-containing protein [Acidimicrobiales bacterium]